VTLDDDDDDHHHHHHHHDDDDVKMQGDHAENPSVHVSFPNYQPNIDKLWYKIFELKFA
jgi:hypothetical protein